MYWAWGIYEAYATQIGENLWRMPQVTPKPREEIPAPHKMVVSTLKEKEHDLVVAYFAPGFSGIMEWHRFTFSKREACRQNYEFYDTEGNLLWRCPYRPGLPGLPGRVVIRQ